MHVVFNQIRYRIGLGFNWTTADVRALLVDSDAWTPNYDDDYVQSILTAGADEMAGGGYARQNVTGRTVALDDAGDRGLWDGNSISFGTVTGTDPYDFLVLYNFVTNDADSWLIAAYDLGAQAADSTVLLFNPPADGYLEWPLSCPGS
jgi:hypothetical protein